MRVAAGANSRRSSSRFAPQLDREKICPGQIATRPGQAGDKTEPDRVVADDEDDGDRRGCRLGRRRRSNAGGSDHGNLPTHQLACQLGESIELIVGRSMLDRQVLAFDVADLLQALTECAQTVGEELVRR